MTTDSYKSARSASRNLNSLDQGLDSANPPSALPPREQILHFPLPFLTEKQRQDYAHYYNPPKRGRIVFGKWAPFADIDLLIDGNRILKPDDKADEYIMDKIRREFKAEQKDVANVDKVVARMAGKSDTKLRINEFIVLRTTPRYITIAKRIQTNEPDAALDPVWLIEKIRGKLPPHDKELLNKNIASLLAKTYKINGRAAKTIKYSDFFFMYSPIETELPDDTVRLTQNWAVTGPKTFMDEFRVQLDQRKNGRAGYSKEESNRVYKALQLISTYRLNEYSRQDIEKEFTEEDDVTGTILEQVITLMKSFNLKIPLNAQNEIDLSIVPIYSDDDYLTQAIYIDKYVQMEKLLQELQAHGDDGEGTDGYPELVNRITTAMEELRKLIKNDQIITDIKPIHYFENFDFTAPSLDWKISVYSSWNEAVRLERLRRPPFVNPKRVLEKFGKDTQDLTTYTIENVPVPPKLSNEVKLQLGEFSDLEPEFRAAYGTNIQKYILQVAQVAANLDYQPFRQRLQAGEIDILNVTNEQVYPELFENPEFIDVSVDQRPRKLSSLGSGRQKQVDEDEFERAYDDPEESLRSAKSSLGSNYQIDQEEFERTHEDFEIGQARRKNTQNIARFNRWMEDRRNEEANLILHNWQPSVKKDWFPISIAPNNFSLSKWLKTSETVGDSEKINKRVVEVNDKPKMFANLNVERDLWGQPPAKKSSTKPVKKASGSKSVHFVDQPPEPLFEIVQNRFTEFGEFGWFEPEILKQNSLEGYIKVSAEFISALTFAPFRRRLEESRLTSARYNNLSFGLAKLNKDIQEVKNDKEATESLKKEYITKFNERIAKVSTELKSFTDILSLPRRYIYTELFYNASGFENPNEPLQNKELRDNPDEIRLLNSVIASNTKNVENDILEQWKGTDSAITPAKYEFVDLNEWDVFKSSQVGQTCGEEKIYVLTKDGIKCLSKQEISQNMAEYAKYNRGDLNALLD